jgi:hypothetical protein
MTKPYPCVTSHTCVFHLVQFYIYFPATRIFSSWSRVLLEKLTGFQLFKKFPTFYGTRILFFIVFEVSEDTHCEMLNFYCDLGVTANFHRFSKPLRFFVVTMISSRLGNMSRLSWMLPCLVITVLFSFVYLFKECTVNLEDGCCERVINC